MAFSEVRNSPVSAARVNTQHVPGIRLVSNRQLWGVSNPESQEALNNAREVLASKESDETCLGYRMDIPPAPVGLVVYPRISSKVCTFTHNSCLSRHVRPDPFVVLFFFPVLPSLQAAF